MSLGERRLSGERTIDFLKLWKRGLVVSAVLMVISIGALVGRGLNFGIDFEGGIAWEVSATSVSVDETRSALEPLGIGEPKIQTIGADVIRVQASTDAADKDLEVADALAELAGVDREDVSISEVGPSWGEEITRSAARALVFFFAAILVYLSVRLEWRMAVATLVAVAHDIVLSAGVYALFQFDVSPATVISFLTILGYSIYDTIVVFDKVQENVARPSIASKLTYSELMNLSMNQVLLRSINTTVTSLIPVLCILVIGSFVLGVTTLQEFSLALAIGLTAGAYSSIFIAAPVVNLLKGRQPARRSPPPRSTRRPSNPRPVATDAGGAAVGVDEPASPATGPAPTPRPRKKKRR